MPCRQNERGPGFQSAPPIVATPNAIIVNAKGCPFERPMPLLGRSSQASVTPTREGACAVSSSRCFRSGRGAAKRCRPSSAAPDEVKRTARACRRVDRTAESCCVVSTKFGYGAACRRDRSARHINPCINPAVQIGMMYEQRARWCRPRNAAWRDLWEKAAGARVRHHVVERTEDHECPPNPALRHARGPSSSRCSG